MAERVAWFIAMCLSVLTTIMWLGFVIAWVADGDWPWSDRTDAIWRLFLAFTVWPHAGAFAAIVVATLLRLRRVVVCPTCRGSGCLSRRSSHA